MVAASAITAPLTTLLVGMLSDRTHSRWGRRRPASTMVSRSALGTTPPGYRRMLLRFLMASKVPFHLH